MEQRNYILLCRLSKTHIYSKYFTWSIAVCLSFPYTFLSIFYIKNFNLLRIYYFILRIQLQYTIYSELMCLDNKINLLNNLFLYLMLNCFSRLNRSTFLCGNTWTVIIFHIEQLVKILERHSNLNLLSKI